MTISSKTFRIYVFALAAIAICLLLGIFLMLYGWKSTPSYADLVATGGRVENPEEHMMKIIMDCSDPAAMLLKSQTPWIELSLKTPIRMNSEDPMRNYADISLDPKLFKGWKIHDAACYYSGMRTNPLPTAFELYSSYKVRIYFKKLGWDNTYNVALQLLPSKDPLHNARGLVQLIRQNPQYAKGKFYSL